MLSQAPAAPPAFPKGPSPSPLDSAYDFGALAEDRQDARQAAAVHSSPASGMQASSACRCTVWPSCVLALFIGLHGYEFGKVPLNDIIKYIQIFQYPFSKQAIKEIDLLFNAQLVLLCTRCEQPLLARMWQPAHG